MKKILLVILYVLIIITNCYADEIRNEKYYNDINNKKYNEVIKDINNLKNKDNDDLYFLGLAYFHINDHDSATKIWNEYIKVEDKKSKNKWIATFPPKSNPIWKIKDTESKRSDLRRSSYFSFKEKFELSSNIYKK